MPNTIETKLTVKTDEGVANVNKLADATEALSRRAVKAAEAQVRATAANTRATQELIKQQKLANDAVGVGEKAASAGAAATNAIREATKATHEFSLANAGAAREMLVLFHEGITGNFKRAAGSMLVLGERTGAAGAIFSTLLSPLGAVLAATGALAAAQYEGAKSSEDFRRAMILTGGAAGVTEGQFRAMAQAIGEQTGRGVGVAKEALQQLVASGQVAPQNLAKMGTSVVQIAHLTGESAEQVAKQFEDMAGDVVGWIQRHKQYADSLTSSQVETIRQLQKMGDIQGAVSVALDAMNAKTADSAGFWGRLGAAVSNAFEKFSHFQGGTHTAEDALAELDARIAATKQRLTTFQDRPGTIGFQQDSYELKTLAAQRAAAAQVAADGQAAAARKGVEQATQNAGKAARQHLDAMLEETKGAEGLREALKKLHDEIAAAAKAGTPVSAEQQKELEAKVTKAHRDPADKKEQNAYEATLKALTDEKAKLEAITASYVKYGHAVDETREAVLRARLASASNGTPAGDLAGLSSVQKARLLADAVDTDKASTASKEAEHLASVEKQVKAYRDLTEAKDENTREGYIAAALQAHGLALSEQTTAALRKQATVLAASAGERYDGVQKQRFEEDAKKRQISVDAEIDAINRQNDALHQGTLAREIAADVAKLQKNAEEELARTHGHEAEIQEKLADNIAAVTAARRRQYADSRSAQTGASNAGTKWAEDASNAANAAAKMTTSSLDDVTAAIEKMTRTGKFSFKDLWKTMADEFLSNIIRMQVAKLATGAGNLWGSVFSALSAAGGGGSGGGSGSELAALDGARAAGGNVNAGGTYLVGEKGPELFRSAAAGSIVPNDELGGSGGGMTIHVGQGQVINVGQGVSRAEVAQAVTQGNAATLKQVQRLSSTGKLRG